MIGPNKTLPQSAYERFDYAPEALNHLQVTFAEHGDVRAGLENAIDRHELRVSSSLYKSWNRLTNGWPVQFPEQKKCARCAWKNTPQPGIKHMSVTPPFVATLDHRGLQKTLVSSASCVSFQHSSRLKEALIRRYLP